MLATTLKFLFCPSTSQLASALLSSPPQHTQPREGQTPPWGAVSWRSRTHDPSQSRDQDSSWRVAMEAAGREEHGPLPQPVTSLQLSFSRQLHPPPQRGPARPPSRACPCLTKGNQICCSCSVREQALPETGEAAGERFLPARGCKYLYNVVRGKGENRGRWQERGGTETAD